MKIKLLKYILRTRQTTTNLERNPVEDEPIVFLRYTRDHQGLRKALVRHKPTSYKRFF